MDSRDAPDPTTRVLILDGARSQVTLRTTTRGLFSPLAHDLELTAGGARGEARLMGEDGATARVEFPVAVLRVAGAVKRGRVDAGVLSADDRREIERRIRENALPGDAIEVHATLAREDPGGAAGGSASLRVVTLSGTATVPASVVVVRGEDGAREASGRCTLSLRALGVPEVRGPLGAFRVADGVEVSFRVVFAPATP